MSEIRKGALLSYGTILVANISGLLLTPAIIRALGNAEYGLYVLIGSFAGYLGVLDFGLNNAVTRYVAQCEAEGDRRKESSFLGAALVVNGIAALTILVVGAVIYSQIELLFGTSLGPVERDRARVMLAMLIASVMLTVSGSLFTAISTGRERFVFPKAVNIVRYVIRIGLVLALLAAGGKAIALIALDMVLSLLVFLVNATYALGPLKAKFAPRPIDTALIRQVCVYSAWIFLFAIIGQFQWQTGQVVIGATLDTASVAVYSIGILLGTYYGAFSTAITGLFMPRATRMTVKNANADQLTMEMAKIGRISLIVLMLILGGFFCFGRQFVYLWVGPDYRQSWLVALIIMLIYTIPLVQSFANQLLEARGLFAFKAKTYLVALPIGVLVGSALLLKLGVIGMAIGIAAGWASALVVINYYYARVIGLDIPEFFKSLARGILPVLFLCIALGVTLNELVSAEGWFGLGVKVFLFSCAYAGLMIRFGMSDAEKSEIDRFLKGLKWTRA